MNGVSLRTAVLNVSGSIARLHLLGPATIGSVGPDWSGGGGVGQPGLDWLEGGDCCKPSRDRLTGTGRNGAVGECCLLADVFRSRTSLESSQFTLIDYVWRVAGYLKTAQYIL
jgi:hypothetical protein